MSLNSIKEYVRGANSSVFLPGIQREFVWNPSQIEELFDSLIRGYPIGSAVEWDVQQSNHNYTTYDFITYLINEDGYVPSSIQKSKYTRNNKLVEPDNCSSLIIDGQQRLTALKIGFEGSVKEYTGGQGKKKSNPDNWSEKVLCINVLGHPGYEEKYIHSDYEFEFKKKEKLKEYTTIPRFSSGGEEYTIHLNPEQTKKKDEKDRYRIWVSVPSLYQEGNELIPEENEEVLKEFIDERVSKTNEEAELFKVLVDKTISDLCTVTEQDFSTVEFENEAKHIPEIFQRLNTKGKTPKPYQLLLSKLMSDWPHKQDNPFNPREKAEKYISQYQESYTGFEDIITRQFILRCICYISGTELRRGAINSLQKADLELMADRWYRGKESTENRFTSAIRDAFETVEQIGFDDTSLDKEPLVALIVKFYYYSDKSVTSENKTEIKKFLAMCLLLNETYDIARRSKASEMAKTIDESVGDTFPRKDIFREMNFNPSKEDIEDLISQTEYTHSQKEVSRYTNGNAAAVLALLEELHSTGSFEDLDIDHIFPHSRADEVDSPEKIHHIANLQLLPYRPNREEKNNHLPLEWIEEEDIDLAGLAETQHFPTWEDYEQDSEDEELPEGITKENFTKELLKPENFDLFLKYRQKRIVDVLNKNYIEEDA